MTTEIAKRETDIQMSWNTRGGFELMQRAAGLLAASALVPEAFRGNVANCTIALEMAHRMGASPLMVMQNLYLVHGKPSWSSQFIIAAVNSTCKFSPLRFQLDGAGDERTCVAWSTEKATGERLESPPISIGMSKREGWYQKNGSKWQTMPELMLRYRAATLFGRLYAPEVLMGMQSSDEVEDTVTIDQPPIYVCEQCGAEMSATDVAIARKICGSQICAECRKVSTPATQTEPSQSEPEPQPQAEPVSDPVTALRAEIEAGRVNKAKFILASRRAGCYETASGLTLPDVSPLGADNCSKILEVLK